MVSEKQLTANRLNAVKSTGPRTPQGKAKSSQNATKHCLLSKNVVLSTESRRQFNAFRRDMFEALAPEGTLEVLLADRVVVSAWQLQRAIQAKTENLEDPIAWRRSEIREKAIKKAVEEELHVDPRDHLGLKRDPTREDLSKKGWTKYQQILERIEEPKEVWLGQVFSEEAKHRDLHAKLSRYEIQHENSMYRALRELERRQARRRGQPVLAPVAVDVAISGGESQNN